MSRNCAGVVATVAGLIAIMVIDMPQSHAVGISARGASLCTGTGGITIGVVGDCTGVAAAVAGLIAIMVIDMPQSHAVGNATFFASL